VQLVPHWVLPVVVPQQLPPSWQQPLPAQLAEMLATSKTARKAAKMSFFIYFPPFQIGSLSSTMGIVKWFLGQINLIALLSDCIFKKPRQMKTGLSDGEMF
jgi:hypothetical protein